MLNSRNGIPVQLQPWLMAPPSPPMFMSSQPATNFRRTCNPPPPHTKGEVGGVAFQSDAVFRFLFASVCCVLCGAGLRFATAAMPSSLPPPPAHVLVPLPVAGVLLLLLLLEECHNAPHSRAAVVRPGVCSCSLLSCLCALERASSESGMGQLCSNMAKEGFFDHIARRASIIAERLELEACHAGTEEAEMNRHIFSATKKNTKAPKERTVQDILKLCNDPASIVACLRLITSRLSKSGDAVSIIKTISVWLRCLSSGDSQFVQLCSDYVNLKIVSQDMSDNCALVFANTGCEYVQARLQTFAACKYEYEKEGSGKTKLISLEPPVMLHQMGALMAQIEVVPKCSDSEVSGIGAEACKYLLGQFCGDIFPIFRAMTQGLEVLFQNAAQLQQAESEQYLMILVRMGKWVSRMTQLLDQFRPMINTEMLLDPKVPHLSY